jgi:hypothetical protein
MKFNIRCVLITTIILVFSDPVFSENFFRGDNCVIVNDNCYIQSGDVYMENNGETYIDSKLLNDSSSAQKIESDYHNFNTENNYYGEGTLEFAMHYISEYDRNMYYNYNYSIIHFENNNIIYLNAPDHHSLPHLQSNEFNGNIGLSDAQRLDTLKLTSYNGGGFRINGNIYINNLTSDANQDLRNNDEYNDYGTKNIHNYSMPSNVNRISNFASNIFDVKNSITLKSPFSTGNKNKLGGGLNFIFDNNTNSSKIINAQFGKNNDRFEIISIENNRNIADGEVSANFNKNIYAHQLDIRTELESETTKQSEIEQVASNININFNNITADIKNINLGTEPPTESINYHLGYMLLENPWEEIQYNTTASAPFSQLSGTLILNDSKVEAENFNLGDYGTLKINITDSTKDSGVEADNISFTTNSNIIIKNNNSTYDTSSHTLITSTNSIKDAKDLAFDITTDNGGVWQSSTNLKASYFNNIVQIDENTNMLYDVSFQYYDNNDNPIDSDSTDAINKIDYNFSVKEDISSDKSHNNLLKAILTSDNSDLSIIKNSLHSQYGTTKLEKFTDNLLNTHQTSSYIDMGYINNSSRNIIGNRISHWMADANVNDNLSSFDLNLNNLELKNNITNILNKSYSSSINRNNNNFTAMRHLKINDFQIDKNNGFWIKPFGGIYDYKGENEFDANMYGILTGIDKRLYNTLNYNYHSLIGLSYGYFESNIDSVNNSEIKTASNQIYLYNANYHNSGQGLYNKNILSLTYRETNTKRNINDQDTTLHTANGNFNNIKYSINSSIGYAVNASDKLNISAEAMVGYNYFEDYKYTETDAGSMNMTIENDGYGALISDLSLKLSGRHEDWKISKHKYKNNKNVILIYDKYVRGYTSYIEAYSYKPSISLSWLRNYNHRPKGSKIKFDKLPEIDYISTNVDGLPRDIYSANIGLEILKLSNLSTVDLSYKIEGGEDYIGHSAYAKYSIKF